MRIILIYIYIYVSYILFEDSELPMSTTIPVKAELLHSKLFQDTYVVVQIPSVIFILVCGDHI